jgi:KDO2-lipid IV(A) lauroyltransferase
MKSKHILEYIALRCFISFISLLPQTLAIKTGRKVGQLSTFFIKKRIALAHHNLELAYKNKISLKERNKIISNLFQMLGEAAIEAIIFKKNDLDKNISVDGWEHLENALKKGKGVILFGPHLGMWELASYIFGSRLKNASTVYKSLENPMVNNYVIKNREKIAHLDLIPSKNGLKHVIKKLRDGLMVGMFYDQNAGKNGLPAKFFGRTAYTYSAAAAFAQKTGCAVVPAYIIREPGFRKHRIIIDKPIPLIDTGDKEKDIMTNTQQYNDYLEDVVRKYPDQWFGWIHRRWRIPGRILRMQQAAKKQHQ